MRKNHQEQPALLEPWLDHEHAKELKAISDLLDANPMIAELAAQDLVPVDASPERGRLGMSGDLVVRAAVVRQMNGFGYEALAFHLQDSATYRRFCRLGLGDNAPGHSALGSNIKRLSPRTWEAVNRIVVAEGVRRKVENGRKVRTDCTPVASPIHDPDDAWLLWDVVRVVARNLAKAKKLCRIEFSNRTRRAKRRMLNVRHAKKSSQRQRAYRDLIDVTIETLEFIPAAVGKLHAYTGEQFAEAMGLAAALEHYEPLGWRVLDQTFRRVCEGNKVPATEKIVSIFEEHTDIIVKDRRDVHYGHKVCLTTGASMLILDCQILDGNPADSTLVAQMLARQKEIFGRVPRQVAMDGGFASKDNVKDAKKEGVKDVSFCKRRGIEITDMVKSLWVYKRLKRFRAGIEAGISFLKRCFGMDRCRWRGLQSFHSYVWASVVTCNLLLLARHALA